MVTISIKQQFTYYEKLFVPGVSFLTIADLSDEGEYTIPKAASVVGIIYYQLYTTINGYINLNNNWDGYDASPISKVAINSALDVLSQLNREEIFSEGIEINAFPMRDGGIQFEFDLKDLSAELEIDANGQMLFLIFDEKASIIRKELVHKYDLSEFPNLLMECFYGE